MLDMTPPALDRTERAQVEGFEAVRLRSPAAELEATFVPAAGMVGASLRHAGAELLWRGDGVRRYAGGRTTMGVPLLHPWANRLARDSFAVAGRRVHVAASGAPPRDERGLAIHGLLGGSPLWRRVSGTGLSAELDFAAQPRLMAAFPFPHRLRLDVDLRGATLTVTTTLTPTGDVAVPLAFGFHPYLRLPDVPRGRWQVELPAMRRLELDDRGLPTGAGRDQPAWAGALADRTFDDGFTGVAPGSAFVLAGGRRTITVRFDDGFPVAQLFAPAAPEVLCFEPMTAPTNALVTGDGLSWVRPGEARVATFSIAVEPREAPTWSP